MTVHEAAEKARHEKTVDLEEIEAFFQKNKGLRLHIDVYKRQEQTKAAVPMQGDTMPYQVGLFRFAPDCGLYFILSLIHI